MKRGALNFLGRKNQSLFDTGVKMKDMDHVEFVAQSAAIPESGTASVRARPTVKHHSSSMDSFHGFAVPTPKVPVLPPVNGPRINGSVGSDRLSNGSVISIPDLVEGEIFVPPPPSMAPPPPPGTFIPPPPDFMGDLNSLDLENIQPPSMPAPKTPSLAPSIDQEDFSCLKPPPMAPPKPPSVCSSSSGSSIPICSPPAEKVPQHPKFAPPPPPVEKQQKTQKVPPPKPVRYSSVPSFDLPPQTPAPPPPVQTPTLSSFNPQHTAKLYNVPENPIVGGYEACDTKPKKVLLLEDSGSVNSNPVLVQVDGKSPKGPPTLPKTANVTPVTKDIQVPKKNVQITKPNELPKPELKNEAKTVTVPAEPEVKVKPLPSPLQKSPQLEKVNSAQVKNSEPSRDRVKGSPVQSRSYSPILDRKLRNMKGGESNGPRDGPVASPLALLMAAKEREKQRSVHSLSRENSDKKNQQRSASIQQSDSSPNSFVVCPVPSSLTATEDRLKESPKTPATPSSPAQTQHQMSTVNHPVVQKQNTEQSPSKSQHQDITEELNIPLLPPPPEFGDFDGEVEPPPSICPPDPPVKRVPASPVSHLSPTQVPTPPPKITTPAAPKFPPPIIDVKPKPPIQTKPKLALTQQQSQTKPKSALTQQQAQATPTQQQAQATPKSALTQQQSQTQPKSALTQSQAQTNSKLAPTLPSTNLSPSQTTLLSILQKKMLEMDQRMAPVQDAESTNDDWSTPLSDEDSKVPAAPTARTQTKKAPAVNKTATLDMQELERKVVKKYQETSPLKAPTSNGVHSKHQYGLTFKIRPGTTQPITLVNKDDP
ncbi:proline-rich extensin-like protein EPR1 [Mugil cephalus]|uniref:proline-rich extensin-like protein EPR1 n=1 Tax=Mugil cephalus TaxID=48193 RepID=UPI001FB830AF|nr:proline-rich extensin-like protein EPR1 [Mugil cephalus]